MALNLTRAGLRAPALARSRAALLVAAGCALVVVVGLAWWLANLPHEPPYGDTVEYWGLAQTLHVDSWRTLAYPLLLRAVGGEDTTGARVPVYVLQLAVALVSAYYFVDTLDRAAGFASGFRTRLGRAVVITAMPLVAHFSVSILTDSLSASFFVLGVAGLVRLFVLGDTRAQTLAVTAIGVAGAPLIRDERVLPFLALGILLAVWALVRRKPRRLVFLAAGVILLALLVTGGNRATQHGALYGRPQPSFTLAVFDRSLHGRFADMWPSMPATIRQRVSLQEARQWDTDPNMLNVIGPRLGDASGRAAMRQAVWQALKCCAPQIAAESMGDAAKYVVAPFAYGVEATVRNGGFSRWTTTRVAVHDSPFSYVYLDLSFVLTVALAALFLVRLPALWSRQTVRDTFLLLAAAVVMLSLPYALRSGAGFHPRYALPTYMIELGLLVAAIAWLPIGRPRRVAGLPEASSTAMTAPAAADD